MIRPIEHRRTHRQFRVLVVALVLAAIIPTAFSASAARYHHQPGCRSQACDARVIRKWERRWVAHEASSWAIPEAIVMCESGGQNDPPNYAGAAGYYQLTEWPSKAAGLPVGQSGDASEHSKAEQDQVAGRLYREQGTGPWVSSEPCWGGRV